MKSLRLLPLLLVCLACSSTPNQDSLFSWLQSLESIEGTDDYLASPYVTAGDRLYIVGHQDGSFPDLGWHVTGEMGGIWNHPIKLMDGFVAQVEMNGTTTCLDQATHFVNYPMGNAHHFELEGLKVTRSQFVPDMTEGVYVEYELTNHSSSDQTITFHFNGMIDLMPVWLGERTNMIDNEDEASYDASLDAIVGKDKGNDWYVIYKSSLPSIKSMEMLLKKEVEKSGATIEVTEIKDLNIAMDRKLIEQVLINLITNARHAVEGKPDAHIKVSVTNIDNQPTIQVSDNGIGIDEHKMEQIFIPFFSTKEHGSGIGLSLSKQIMKKHGGNLTVKSEIGLGSTFSLSFRT